MLLLGIDIGTSSVKVTLLDGQSGETLASSSFPDTEAPITVKQPGWAEQAPDDWWEYFKQALARIHAKSPRPLTEVGAIGIAYQMHGLVITDAENKVLRDSIIWCDSRAVPYGAKAAQGLGADYCRTHLLNDPGNFTAAKLAWVKEQEPDLYHKIAKIMLPGDYIALRLTGESTTSPSALSEGIFWDFKTNAISEEVLHQFGFPKSIFPDVRPVFSEHGGVTAFVAAELGLKAGVPVTYKAGDQPNNALSLNVMQPCEVAATAGTSGVIYAVTDQLLADKFSRVNSFAHVNHTGSEQRIGVLLCINGTGSLNSWVKKTMGNGLSYNDINQEAASVAEGSEGLSVLPFGNGAERIFENRLIGAHFNGVDLNLHTNKHLYRAAQEGIACSFRYGLDILRENGFEPSVIRAGYANMFLSDLFTQAFVNVTGVSVELHPADGSVGAAIGAGIGAGFYRDASQAFGKRKALRLVEPSAGHRMDEVYAKWKDALDAQLNKK